MKKITYEEFKQLLSKGDLYFINSFENAVIRTEKEERIIYYVKFKGEEEFKAEKGSDIIVGGWEEHTIITKEEYETY